MISGKNMDVLFMVSFQYERKMNRLNMKKNFKGIKRIGRRKELKKKNNNSFNC
jgi:hypothetical protein